MGELATAAARLSAEIAAQPDAKARAGLQRRLREVLDELAEAKKREAARREHRKKWIANHQHRRL